jgi:hypothetical protein
LLPHTYSAFVLVQFSVYEVDSLEINAFEIDGQPHEEY